MTAASSTASGLAEVNGTRLYYEVSGTGLAVLLLHGGLIDSRMWDDQFAVFAHRYRTLRYDLRGNGRSDLAREPYTDYQDLHALLRFMGIKRTYLIGSSGGSALALDFCLEYPEMVAGLVLTVPGVGGYRWPDETMRLATDFIATWQSGDIAGAVEARLRMLTDGPQRSPEHVDPAVRARIGQITGHALMIERNETCLQPLDPPAIERLSEIQTPTLIVLADKDMNEILRIGELLATQITGAQYVEITGAAHFVNMEQPNEFNRVVLDFLGTVDSV